VEGEGADNGRDFCRCAEAERVGDFAHEKSMAIRGDPRAVLSGISARTGTVRPAPESAISSHGSEDGALFTLKGRISTLSTSRLGRGGGPPIMNAHLGL